MERHLRLAEARGSYQQLPNHRVQDLGLEMLLVMRAIEKERDREDAFKRAWIGRIDDNSKERAQVLFPAYFAKDPYEGARDENGEVDIDRVDPAAVDWRTDVSKDEDEELSRWIREQEAQNLSLVDLDPNGGWV